jgi:TorA maturation chaperone TorD
VEEWNLDQKEISLLSRLWLQEADEAALAGLEAFPGLADLAGQAATPAELAVAYTDLFLLNVYPYASVFLDPNGEMNGQRSREFSALYRQAGYEPETLAGAGAPDHLGLALGLWARLPPAQQAGVLGRYLLDWAPVLCLAIERQPSAHPFYRALAACTRRALFQAFRAEDLAAQLLPLALDARQPPDSVHPDDRDPEDGWVDLPLAGPEEETSLSQVVGFLLCPARSGIFLSRARLGLWARRLGMPLAFGERRRLAISLFEAAGMVDRVAELLECLQAELDAWDAAHIAWAREYSVWGPFAGEWRERIAAARSLLAEAQRTVQADPQ